MALKVAQSIQTIKQQPSTLQPTTTSHNSRRTVDNTLMDRKWHDLTTIIIRRWQITNQRHMEQHCSSQRLPLVPTKFPITYKVTPKTVSPALLALAQPLQGPTHNRTYKQPQTAILIFPQILKQLKKRI